MALRSSCLVAICLIAVCFPASALPAPRAVGIVANVNGAWAVGKERATQGMSVLPGLLVHLLQAPSSTRAKPPYIKIRLLNGLQLERTCSDAASSCAVLYIPKDLKPESGFVQRLIEVAVRLFGHNSRPYSPALVRGVEEVQIFSDGVLRLDGRRLDLGPELTGLPANTYTIPLTQLNASTGALRTHTAVQVSVVWDTKHGMGVVPSSLEPGLFAVGDPSKDETGWVVIASTKDYPRFSAAYAQIEAYAQSWPSSANDEDRRDFARTALRQLAVSSPNE